MRLAPLSPTDLGEMDQRVDAGLGKLGGLLSIKIGIEERMRPTAFKMPLAKEMNDRVNSCRSDIRIALVVE